MPCARLAGSAAYDCPSPSGAVPCAQLVAAAAHGCPPLFGSAGAVFARGVSAAGEMPADRGGLVALRAPVTVLAEGAADPARPLCAARQGQLPARATRAPAKALALAGRTPVETSPKGPAPR
ncbi:hypothetical protein ACFWR9_06945 [Streptomyces sp. NPDC058534]|uniref:hypothetical protein n=1 Tax=Streptomyces sp. NPDC058534 TaxID=3346541 RepID=UPI00365A6B25